MKVIIVEVTRAANTFGRHHLGKISEAYDLIAGIVEQARADGSFKSSDLGRVRGHVLLRRHRAAPVGLDLRGLLPRTDEDFEHAKGLVVDAICGGLEVRAERAGTLGLGS